MKITKETLKKIIKEEIEKILYENQPHSGDARFTGEYSNPPGAISSQERYLREPEIDPDVQADADSGMSCEELKAKHGDTKISKWDDAGGKLPDGKSCSERSGPPMHWDIPYNPDLDK